MAVLTEGDRLMLQYASREVGGFHHATEWYLHGWKPLPYQYKWHQVDRKNATWIGGVATSKTSTSAASYLMDCLAYPYYKALNTSVTAKQAELPFFMIQGWMDGNKKLEHLVQDVKLRPWPIIYFKNGSSYEFRTSGLDARFIRGTEYDRINYDECALDPVGRTVEILRTRLRGVRSPLMDTPRFCRLDTVSSPLAIVWLKERFEKGFRPDQRRLYFSMKTTTWDNTHLTKDQTDAMAAELAPEQIAVEMGADWPEYGGAYFPERYIDQAVDQDLYDDAYIALNPEEPAAKAKPGYRLDEDPRIGITHFELPEQPGNRYILAGDPGRGNPPHRNSGVVLVAEVTRYPYRLIYLDWVFGNGSIRPFLQSYRYAVDKYIPELKGLDVTGTQAMLDEVAFKEQGIATDGINYSGDKYGMLNLLLNDLTSGRWRIPPVQALVRQSKTYSFEADKEDSGFPQDLVTTWAQISFLARGMQRDTTEVNSERPALDNARAMRPLTRAGNHYPVRRRGRR